MDRYNKYYPREVYNINEDITRENMKNYDLKQEKIEKACLKINPEYHKLNLLERRKIREKAENTI